MHRLNFSSWSWGGRWPTMLALLAGAVLLWAGFALALVLAVLGGIALLPAWLRRLWPHKNEPRGPLTIEGSYTKHVE